MSTFAIEKVSQSFSQSPRWGVAFSFFTLNIFEFFQPYL